ncbi:MAG: winged helix-turn-helix domain-containing protein [Sphingomonadales bacterium]|nr:winged helix-turn-helix domain-containing protein [Sphingomonadales bacterium]
MLGSAIVDGLSRHFAVDWVRTLADAEAALRAGTIEFMILDLGLPDGSGLDLLRAERRRGNPVPVIILTARGQLEDRLAGLNSGADDYLVKPFDLDELIARGEAMRRRLRGSGSPVIACGDLVYEPATRTVTLGGEPVQLSARELAVFDVLMGAQGRVIGKDQIEARLYDIGSEVESNTVEVYVSRLRRKIGRDRIVTVRGLGYTVPRVP